MSWIFTAVFAILTWISSANDWPSWITITSGILCGISAFISFAKAGLLGDALYSFADAIDFFPDFSGGGDDCGGGGWGDNGDCGGGDGGD